MSKYECPMMSRGEIVAILNESQIGNISENDLSKPNFDFVSDLYTRLLFHIDCLHEYSSYLYSIPSLFSHFSLRFSKSKPKRKTLTSSFFFLCREEEHGQLEFAALDHLENPDFHVESVRIIKLYNRIKDVLASMDCPKSFTLKDLIKPAPDRTELFLSAILNFGLHRLGLIVTFVVVVEVLFEILLFQLH